MCPVSGKIHPVDHIAPDIELKDMQNLFIDDKFIKTEKILGVGGFAAVYLGSYNAEKVALKSFRLGSKISCNAMMIYFCLQMTIFEPN